MLAYMRRGIIKVDDIDIDVLALAEFLGVERLLLAVKVCWYCNIGKGPVLSEVEAIAAAFDQEHGGILKAITAGLFPCFLRHDDVNVEKDFAVVQCSSDEPYIDTPVRVSELAQGERDPSISCGGLIGALNGIYAKGYTLDEDQIDHSCQAECSMTFSRIRHPVIRRSATDIFIPTNDEIEKQKGSGCIKQFAVYIKDGSGYGDEEIIASAEFNNDPNPFAEANIPAADILLWLERHNFVTREKELEETFLFQWYVESLIHGEDGSKSSGIYSRHISRT